MSVHSRFLVPYQLLVDAVRPTWRELAYGVENGYFDVGDVVTFANDLLVEGDDNARVVALAICERSDPEILVKLRALAADCPKTEPDSRCRLWTFLVLKNLYERRETLDDPLDLVEQIYAETDYPESVAPFVRYMPSDDPPLPTRELNEARLIQKWASYLETETAWLNEARPAVG